MKRYPRQQEWNLSPQVILFTLTLVIFFITGCGGTSEAPKSGSSAALSVASADNKASVDLPDGALSEDMSITVEAAINPPAGSIGTAYEFGPDGSTFLKNVTIKISYDEADLPAGANETDLKLATVVDGAWEIVAGSSIDIATNTASGEVGHFSIYGIIHPPIDSTGTPADNTTTPPDVTAPPTNLTVKVYYDEVGDESTAPVLVANDTNLLATVTLVGTDALSVNGVNGTTSAAGTVFFPNVSGPFTVTAQMDITGGGLMARCAMTVTGLVPVAGQIDLIAENCLDTDVTNPSQSPAPTNSGIDGNILNIPVVLPGYQLEVWAKYANHEWAKRSTSVLGPTATPTASMPFTVNSEPGLYSVAAVILRNPVLKTSPTEYQKAVLHVAGLVEVTSSNFTTITLDFSNPATAVNFTPSTITTTNGMQNPTEVCIEQELDGPGGLEFDFGLFSFDGAISNDTIPSAFTLISSAPAGLTPMLDYCRDGDSSRQWVHRPFSLGAPIQAEFSSGFPSITAPTEGQIMTSAAAKTLTVNFSLGAASPNLSAVVIESKNPDIPGIDQLTWVNVVRPGTTSLTLSPTALPMFGLNGQYGVAVVQVHARDGSPIDFGDFVVFNSGSNLRDLFRDVDMSASSQQFTVFSGTPSPFVGR